MERATKFEELGIDPILPKTIILKAQPCSESTIWREQRAGRFPAWEEISPGRVGLRRSRFVAWLNGKRSGWNGPDADAA